MTLSYREFEDIDAKWLDDIALISRIVKQYEESQAHLKSSNATLGNPTGSTIR
jgi:hypothetical protein